MPSFPCSLFVDCRVAEACRGQCRRLPYHAAAQTLTAGRQIVHDLNDRVDRQLRRLELGRESRLAQQPNLSRKADGRRRNRMTYGPTSARLPPTQAVPARVRKRMGPTAPRMKVSQCIRSYCWPREYPLCCPPVGHGSSPFWLPSNLASRRERSPGPISPSWSAWLWPWRSGCSPASNASVEEKKPDCVRSASRRCSAGSADYWERPSRSSGSASSACWSSCSIF